MGTVFTIAVRDPGEWDVAIADVVCWLHRVDALFSPYQADSQISRMRRGELTLNAADPLVREVLALCDQYEQATDGYFTAHLPDGLDPTGLVKGWAIERASARLRGRGSHNHAVNGGGDIQMAGEAAPGRPWRVGISDPQDPARILSAVVGRDFAVATSGVAERGAHIVNPRGNAPTRDLASVTVVGGSLTCVDAYATAAFAMGDGALTWLEDQPVEGLVVSADRSVRCTRRFGLFAHRRHRGERRVALRSSRGAGTAGTA